MGSGLERISPPHLVEEKTRTRAEDREGGAGRTCIFFPQTLGLVFKPTCVQHPNVLGAPACSQCSKLRGGLRVIPVPDFTAYQGSKAA